jgi:hypothetical protein
MLITRSTKPKMLSLKFSTPEHDLAIKTAIRGENLEVGIE